MPAAAGVILQICDPSGVKLRQCSLWTAPCRHEGTDGPEVGKPASLMVQQGHVTPCRDSVSADLMLHDLLLLQDMTARRFLSCS